MDYEKKYKESMAKMSTFLSKHDGFTISKDGEMYKELSEIFPELKESEDERIRKHLIKHFGNKSKEDWNGVPVKSILAWLEKQGEQKHAEWSEEDEKCLENAIMYCKWARDIAPNLYCYETSEKSINWLKSLRPQTTWKPSDEQIIELRRVISCCSYDIEPLVEIEEQLKKLKE